MKAASAKPKINQPEYEKIAVKGRYPEHLDKFYMMKYTNPANPVRNFCKQKLRPLP